MLYFNSIIVYNSLMMIEKGTKMSIEELLLDTGKSLENEMTEFEKNCYGMSTTAIRQQYMNSITAKLSGLEMVAMGILSDCQEMLAMDASPRSVEGVRKQMNVAKFILSEMMDRKEVA